MAASFYAASQYSSALAAYTAALEASLAAGQPVHATVYINRALVHAKLELHRRCLKDCNAALALDPQNLRAHLLKGDAYSALRKLGQARRAWEAGAAQGDGVCGDVEVFVQLVARLRERSAGGGAGAGAGEGRGVAAHGAAERRGEATDRAGAVHAAANHHPAVPSPPPATKTEPNAIDTQEVVALTQASLQSPPGGATHSSSSSSSSMSSSGFSSVSSAGSSSTAAAAAAMRVEHGTGSTALDEAMAVGYQKVNTGQYGEAAAIFSSLLQRDPRMFGALLGRGSALAMTGDLRGALRDFSEAVDADPSVPDALNRRGQTLAVLGQWEDAVADFTRSIKLGRGNASGNASGSVRSDARGGGASALVEAYQQRGHLYQQAGWIEKADADFRAAADYSESPAMAQPHGGAGDAGGANGSGDSGGNGQIIVGRGGAAAVVAAVAAATEAALGSKHTHQAPRQAGKTGQAEQTGQTGKGLAGAIVWNAQGLSAGMLGDNERAVRCFQKAIKLSSEGSGAGGAGRAGGAGGAGGAGSSSSQEGGGSSFTVVVPSFFKEAHLNKAQALRDMGQGAAALACLDGLLAAVPTYAQGYHLRGLVRYGTGDVRLMGCFIGCFMEGCNVGVVDWKRMKERGRTGMMGGRES